MAITRNNHSKKVAILFGEGDSTSAEVLGGKGAGLAELVRLGMPVPPGFTVTTSVARAFGQHQCTPKRLQWQTNWGIEALERKVGKRFGASHNPLLVSVRSGAAVSMPGMMDTVLNLGMNPEIAHGLARLSGPRFAWDCYRRFLTMFGQVVLNIPTSFFQEILTRATEQRGLPVPGLLLGTDLEAVCGEYLDMIKLLTERPMTDDPREQLEMAQAAVLRSWNNPRAVAFRLANRISGNLGTAVNIQSMVFGNKDNLSGTGVAFSRNVVTGEPGLWGEFLVSAQGEDVVAGTSTPMPLSKMACWDVVVHRELEAIVAKLAAHRGHVVDVEFTVESGKLWILQVRAANLTAEAAATAATHAVWDKKVPREKAVTMVPEEQVQKLRMRGFKPSALQQALATRLVGKGLPASPGAAVGTVVTSSRAAVEAAAKGQKVILVRPDTSPDDLDGMLAAIAIVTETGGATSHAAVVARGLGKPAVVGCSNPAAYGPSITTLAGRTVSVDGQTGAVMLGEVELSDVARKKEVNIFLRWAAQEEAKNWRKPLLRFEMFEAQVSINRLLNDFYISDAMARAASGTALASECGQLKTRVHNEAAERIAMYLVVAIGGEVRHAKASWADCATELDALTKVFNVKLDRNDRAEAQRSSVEQLKTMAPSDHVRFVDLVAAVFDKGTWDGAFGGKKWAAIARAAHGFLTGQLTHSVFADHAFDLQHNGGCVFGKHPMLSGDRYKVRQALDGKKHATSVLDLYERLRIVGGSMSKMEASPEVEQLYRKGEQLGIWGAQQEGKQVGVRGKGVMTK